MALIQLTKKEHEDMKELEKKLFPVEQKVVTIAGVSVTDMTVSRLTSRLLGRLK